MYIIRKMSAAPQLHLSYFFLPLITNTFSQEIQYKTYLWIGFISAWIMVCIITGKLGSRLCQNEMSAFEYEISPLTYKPHNIWYEGMSHKQHSTQMTDY